MDHDAETSIHSSQHILRIFMTSNDIYSILESKPHNPHYLKRYFKFIVSCTGMKNTSENIPKNITFYQKVYIHNLQILVILDLRGIKQNYRTDNIILLIGFYGKHLVENSLMHFRCSPI